jgi:hypothetical protein
MQSVTDAGKRQQRALPAQQRLFRNPRQYGHRPTVTGNDRLTADGGRRSQSITTPGIAPIVARLFSATMADRS